MPTDRSLPNERRPTTLALIVAAGRGQRARAPGETAATTAAKQYLSLAGKAVVLRATTPFLDHPAIDWVQVVIHPDDVDLYAAAMAPHGSHPKLLPPIPGGATRQQSVARGLDAHAAPTQRAPPDRVLVHDAARPFVTRATISAIVAALDRHQAVIAATAVTDTLQKTNANGLIEATLPRDDLWRAQTPQGFLFPLLLAAHQNAAASDRHDFTDDAAVVIATGQPVMIVASDPANTKLTTPEDFRLAERLLTASALPDVRVGHGIDVHRFTTGNHIWLCGVKISHSHGVDAHSDGDVALHALTDALLGAIADGDIGQHFKNTDPRWKGASSDTFLADAAARVRARAGQITSVDLTILAEAPKIGPHRDQMRARVAAILGINISRVGLKATTTETLGFTGRSEGLAAMATATVIFPPSEI